MERLLELDFSTFAQLGNGQLERQVQKLIRQAVQDMENRPGEKRARKVRIILSLSPKTHVEANEMNGASEVVLDGAGLKVECGLVVPTRQSMEFDVGFGIDHQVLFNPDSPHNHRQRMLPAMDVDEATVPMDRRSAAVGS